MTARQDDGSAIGLTEDRAAALLARTAASEEMSRGAEACLRRLANRHGCTLRIDGCFLAGECPDPAAHRRDVADMTVVLQAAGLAPSESSPNRTWCGRPARGGNAS